MASVHSALASDSLPTATSVDSSAGLWYFPTLTPTLRWQEEGDKSRAQKNDAKQIGIFLGKEKKNKDTGRENYPA